MVETIKIELTEEENDIETIRNLVHTNLSEKEREVIYEIFMVILGGRDPESVNFDELEQYLIPEFYPLDADIDGSLEEFMEDVAVNYLDPDELTIIERGYLLTGKYVFGEDTEEYKDDLNTVIEDISPDGSFTIIVPVE